VFDGPLARFRVFLDSQVERILQGEELAEGNGRQLDLDLLAHVRDCCRKRRAQRERRSRCYSDDTKS
jgi:hypothetical protein